MGRPFTFQNSPVSVGDLDPIQYIVSWVSRILNTNSISNLDRFSRFCRAHYCDRQADRQTTLYSVCNNRLHLRTKYCDTA